jgi:hypothetical protein
MANTVITLKKSAVPSSKPTSLSNGELAINFADGTLYYKNLTGQIVSFSSSSSGSNSFSTINANGTLVVASSPSDILTIISGSNIQIDGDAVNDRITISAISGGAAFDKANTANLIASGAFDKANSANLLAFNTGSGANSYASSVGTGANNYLLTVIAGANTAVGTGANAFTSATIAGANVITTAAFTKANSALPNTSGVSFNGNLNFPTGSIGIGTASPAATLDVRGSISMAGANVLSQTLTNAASIVWDTSLGQVANVTLTANISMGAPTNLRVGTYVLNVLQDSNGSRTLTWNSVFKWPAGVAPVLTLTGSRRDIIFFFSDGTNLYGSFLPDVR